MASVNKMDCFFYRVVGTEERIPIPLMDYILNVVSAESANSEMAAQPCWVCFGLYYALHIKSAYLQVHKRAASIHQKTFTEVHVPHFQRLIVFVVPCFL